MDRGEKGIFDGEAAQKGYALNKMCYAFNIAANRAAFRADEDGFCAKYGLNQEQREAIRSRDRARLVAAGGNLYYLVKFMRVFETAGGH